MVLLQLAAVWQMRGARHGREQSGLQQRRLQQQLRDSTPRRPARRGYGCGELW